MPNAFDRAQYPTREPATLVAGDRWAWKRTDLGADYPPASYTLKYSLRLEAAGGAEIEITALADGADFVIEVAAAVTASKTPGHYDWQAYIVRQSDSERLTIGSGTLEVIANRDVSTDDPRTLARRMVEALRAALLALAADGVDSYSITMGSGSRTVTKADRVKLRQELQYWEGRLADEEAKAGLAAATGMNPRNIGIRFRRV